MNVPIRGRRPQTILRAVASLLVIVFWAASPAPGSEEQAAREWTQFRGNPQRTGSVDVIPIRTTPEVLWRRKVDTALAANLVTWSGHVFFVEGKSLGLRLVAIRAQTGEQVARFRLPRGQPLHLVSWQNTVAVCGPQSIQAFRLVESKLRRSWKLREGCRDAPLVTRGILVLGGGDRFVDMRSGEILRNGSGFLGPVTLGGADGRTLAGITIGLDVTQRAPQFLLLRTGMSGLGSPNIRQRPWPPLRIANAALTQPPRWRSRILLVPMPTGVNRWLVSFREPLHADRSRWPSFLVLDDKVLFCQLDSQVATYGEHVYGFAFDGKLLKVLPDGRSITLLSRDYLPTGAGPGPVARAREIATFGNLAFNLKSGRVAWFLRGVTPMTPLVPAGDRLLVAATPFDEILGIGPRARPSPKPARPEPDRPEPSLVLSLKGNETFDFTERVTISAKEQGEKHAVEILVVTEGELTTSAAPPGCSRRMRVRLNRLHGHHMNPRYGDMAFDSAWMDEVTIGEGEPKRGPSWGLANRAGTYADFDVSPLAEVTGVTREFSTPARRRGDPPEDADVIAELHRAAGQRYLQVLPNVPLRVGTEWTMTERVAPFYLCYRYSKLGLLPLSLEVTEVSDDAILATIEGEGAAGSPANAHEGVSPSTRTYDLMDWSAKGRVTIDPKTGLLRKRDVEQKFKVWARRGVGMHVVRRVVTTCRRRP
jgi:hypothetical protein